MWLGLSVSYFLLCRASEVRAYDNGQVRTYIPSFVCHETASLSFKLENREIATAA